MPESHADWHLLDQKPPAWVATAVTDARNRAKWSPPDGRSHAHEALRWFHYSREALLAEIARLTAEKESLTREHDQAVQEREEAMWKAVVAGYMQAVSYADRSGYEHCRAHAEAYANSYCGARSPASPRPE